MSRTIKITFKHPNRDPKISREVEDIIIENILEQLEAAPFSFPGVIIEACEVIESEGK